MQRTNPSLTDIFERGAKALEQALQPGRTAHLAIDWQKLYCDPELPLNWMMARKQADSIAAALQNVNDFAASLRGIVPTWWIYHDPELRQEDFPADCFRYARPATVERRLQQFREEGVKLCGHVDPAHDVTFRKPFKSAFDGTGLHEKLQVRDIDTLLITGLYRDALDRKKLPQECVDGTMKEAVRLGYRVYAVDDLIVDKKIPDGNMRLKNAQAMNGEGIECVASTQVQKIVAHYRHG